MAAYGWRSSRSVVEFLFAEAYRFDFYQAVRLLEQMFPDRFPIGDRAQPDHEPVRFRSRVGMSFPASDVHQVMARGGEGPPVRMVVNFMGLAGGFGPLPAPYTELILERLRARDTGLRDFLDIFNHRLVSLLYRARKTHRIGFDPRSPEQTPFAQYCFALIGMGTDGLRGRMGLDDRALLYYAGMLGDRPRSMVGLEAFLSDYFEVQVKGRQFLGQWYRLAGDQRTAIGVSGQNQRLGRDTVLGGRVWDQTGRFLLRIGPLTFAQFQDFLPTGKAHKALCELVRFYAGQDFEFEIQLVLQADGVPESRLGGVDGPRLGWTSWLRTQSIRGSDDQVKLSA